MPEDLGAVQAALARDMQAAACEPSAIAAFLRDVAKVHGGENGLLSESRITPVTGLPDIDRMPRRDPSPEDGLDRVVLIKLNGGLGTSMGLDGPKSLLPVHDGQTFLDIIARQLLAARERHGIRLPLLLMNSFSTEAATAAYLARRPDLGNPEGLPLSFCQGRVPKLLADSLLPATWPQDPAKAWCPPGHGELFAVLLRSGLLADLLAKGFDIAFVSNADNLGATFDPTILAALRGGGWPFLMEVTDRTEADRKGGHLARGDDGRLLLRELAQCPEEDLASFQDLALHRYFNTNNLWLHLPSLAALAADQGQAPELPVICNRKHLVPDDPSSPWVLQLESAMGAAISSFAGAAALRVGRARFRPVKRCSDLLGLWSDAYALTPDGAVALVAERRGREPRVDLDPVHYSFLGQLRAAFPHGAPSLSGCESLSIHGPARFGRGVRCLGRVEVTATADRVLDVPDGTLLQGTWP